MTATINLDAIDQAAINRIHDLTDAYLITHDPALLADITAAINAVSAQTSPGDLNHTLAAAVDAILRGPLADADAATALTIPVDDVREGRRLAARVVMSR